MPGELFEKWCEKGTKAAYRSISDLFSTASYFKLSCCSLSSATHDIIKHVLRLVDKRQVEQWNLSENVKVRPHDKSK